MLSLASDQLQPARVLVVDDDGDIRALLRAIYELSGLEVSEAADGQEAMRLVYAQRPDLIVLDLGMEGIDGWTTLTRIRELTDTPVLVVTGQTGELEKVRALRAGADDYVTKPFGRHELIARSEAVLRRSRPAPMHAPHYDDGLISVSYQSRVATVDGVEVTLTPLEFRLLTAFVRHPNHVLSWHQLLELAWNDGVGTRDQVKVYIAYLRRKLGSAGASIETVRGFGYRYRPGPAASSSPLTSLPPAKQA